MPRSPPECAPCVGDRLLLTLLPSVSPPDPTKSAFSARRKYARPLEAYNARHRHITHFGIEKADGTIATDPEDALRALAAHWTPVFGEGPPVDHPAAETFLRECSGDGL